MKISATASFLSLLTLGSVSSLAVEAETPHPAATAQEAVKARRHLSKEAAAARSSATTRSADTTRTRRAAATAAAATGVRHAPARKSDSSGPRDPEERNSDTKHHAAGATPKRVNASSTSSTTRVSPSYSSGERGPAPKSDTKQAAAANHDSADFKKSVEDRLAGTTTSSARVSSSPADFKKTMEDRLNARSEGHVEGNKKPSMIPDDTIEVPPKDRLDAQSEGHMGGNKKPSMIPPPDDLLEVPLAPRTISACGEDGILVEMLFWSDSYSSSENSVFLMDMESSDLVWNFPLGSFADYDDAENCFNPFDADYYFSTCVSAASCHSLVFGDTFEDFSPGAEVDVFVDGVWALSLTPCIDDAQITTEPDEAGLWYVPIGDFCEETFTPVLGGVSTFVVDDTFDGSCDFETEIKVQMYFYSDMHSATDNAVYLYSMDSNEFVWNYHEGFFTEYGSDALDNADYYFATCLDAFACYEFDFVDTFNDLSSDPLAEIYLIVDEELKFYQGPEEGTGAIDPYSDTGTSVLFYSFIGDCDGLDDDDGEEVEGAPTFFDNTNEGSCNPATETKIEMSFYSDVHSEFENAVYLYPLYLPGDDLGEWWFYPEGSFKEYGSSEFDIEDYYFATCLPKSSCYQFQFLDTYNDFSLDPLAKLDVKVDGLELLGLGPDDVTGAIETSLVTGTSVSFIASIGDCSGVDVSPPVVESAPTDRDDTAGACDPLTEMQVEMFFYTDEYSVIDNALYLYSADGSDSVWNYPIGSFTIDCTEDDSMNTNPEGPDYYFATCLPKSQCYYFDFEDNYNDFSFDPLAEVYVYVDGNEVLEMSPDEDSGRIDNTTDAGEWVAIYADIGSCS